jgi:hypothetical protein
MVEKCVCRSFVSVLCAVYMEAIAVIAENRLGKKYYILGLAIWHENGFV